MAAKNELLNVNEYHFKTWGETFKNNKVDLSKIEVHDSWKDFFKKNKKIVKEVQELLTILLEKTNGEIKMFPYPGLVFNAFNLTPLDKVRVVILGQDPYHGVHNNSIPQAMGLSFSIPVGVKVPSSLENIYKNLKKFNHIKNIPTHGNLQNWAEQGCLMINTSLTVQKGHANSHTDYWKDFSDALIKYISDKCDKLIFILWGRPALSKLNLIDTTKHQISASSHPSGLSCNNKLGQYKSFNDTDHFDVINKFLQKEYKETIIWEL